MTAFKEDAALTESVVWLKDLLSRSLFRPNSRETTTLNVYGAYRQTLMPSPASLILAQDTRGLKRFGKPEITGLRTRRFGLKSSKNLNRAIRALVFVNTMNMSALQQLSIFFLKNIFRTMHLGGIITC